MIRFSRLLVSAALFTSALSVSAQQAQPALSQQASRGLSPSPDLSIDQLEEEGDSLRAQKDYLDAMDYYHAALKKTSTAALHNKTGVCWIQMAHYVEARREFEQAVKLDNKHPEAHNNLGVTYYQMRHYSGAVKEYRKAIKLKDNSASFHMNLGNAYFTLKNYDDAAREFNRALQIDPQVFEPQVSGGVSVKLATQGDRAYFHYTLAKMYGSAGDVERCRAYLSKANEEGYPFVKDALKDSGFAALRKDPEFIVFVRSLKPPDSPQ